MSRALCVIVCSLAACVPLVARAQVSCTGLGDNQLTITGSGVSVQCSKYETPGGGTTKFQSPDGTMCSFENMSPNDVSCGGSPGSGSKIPPTRINQQQLKDLMAGVGSMLKSGGSPEDINYFMSNALKSGTLIADGGVMASAFMPLPEEDTGIAGAPMESFDSLYAALVTIAEEANPQEGSDGQRRVAADLKLLADSKQWVFVYPIDEKHTSLQRMQRVGQPIGGMVPAFYGGEGESGPEPSSCDVLCKVRRAWKRGAVTLFDVLFPIISAGAAGWFAHLAYVRTKEDDAVPNRVP